MSYDIELVDKKTGGIVSAASHTEGGTYAIGGSTCAALNVTYNYAGLFRYALRETDGIRWLYGKTGKECSRRLQAAIRKLESLDRSGPFEDYWAPTPGNAARALKILLGWAREHPTAVFQGD